MTTLPDAAQKQFRQFIERIERMEEEKKALGEDITDVFAEMKAVGYDVKTVRWLLKLRKMSKTDRDEQDAVLEVYMHAMGMLDGTPMGEFLAAEQAKFAASAPVEEARQ